MMSHQCLPETQTAISCRNFLLRVDLETCTLQSLGDMSEQVSVMECATAETDTAEGGLLTNFLSNLDA